MGAGSGRHTSSAPRAVYYALASNIAVAVCKFAVAFYTNSRSAFAEAVHSSADCLNQLVLLVGHRAARATPDEQHPLGFGREIYFYGMLVAMQLFIFGGVASIVIGGFRAMHHSRLERPLLAIGVLCVSGVIEALALRASIRTIEPRHRAKGLLNWFKESGKPSVMLSVSEDLAAVAGVLVRDRDRYHRPHRKSALRCARQYRRRPGADGLGSVFDERDQIASRG
ncbi:Co/Zn/Cd efflux system component [Paraburkholderia sp. WC7.3d]